MSRSDESYTMTSAHPAPMHRGDEERAGSPVHPPGVQNHPVERVGDGEDDQCHDGRLDRVEEASHDVVGSVDRGACVPDRDPIIAATSIVKRNTGRP